jgi:hypothetical protein
VEIVVFVLHPEGKFTMQSDFLFAQPSYLSGAARIFDIGGALNEYNDLPTGEEADALALALDWAMVGEDIRAATRAFEQEHLEPTTTS